MRVIYGLSRLRKPPRNTIATLGSFDGVHRAHQVLLKRIVHRAKARGGTSLLITFDPHPLEVLRPGQPFSLLTCLPDRLKLLSKTGLDLCWVVRFTPSFSRLTADAFVKKVLVDRLKVSEVWVGFQVAFGCDRQGNVSLLRRSGRRYGFKVFQGKKVNVGRELVSSSRIRTLLAQGNFSKASRLLGRGFSIHGKVVRGSGRGHRLGTPTANLSLCGQMLPPLGVYAVWVRLQRRGFWGLLNLGRRPTFSPIRKKPLPEVHLLDFKGRLYGKELEIIFLRRIRDEKRFATRSALQRQVREDERRVRHWIARREVVPPSATALQTRKGPLG